MKRYFPMKKKNLIFQLTLASLVLNVITILLTCIDHSLDSALPSPQRVDKEISALRACEGEVRKQLLSEADTLLTSFII